MAKLSASAQERIIDYIAIVTTIMYVVIKIIGKQRYLSAAKQESQKFF